MFKFLAVALTLGLWASPAYAFDPATWTIIAGFLSKTIIAGITYGQVIFMVGAAIYGSAAQRRAARKARDQFNSSLEDKQASGFSTEMPVRYVYGEDKIGGNIVAMFTSGDKDQYRHLVCVFANHESQSIEDIYLNGKNLGTLDVDGKVQYNGDSETRLLRGNLLTYKVPSAAGAIVVSASNDDGNTWSTLVLNTGYTITGEHSDLITLLAPYNTATYLIRVVCSPNYFFSSNLESITVPNITEPYTLPATYVTSTASAYSPTGGENGPISFDIVDGILTPSAYPAIISYRYTKNTSFVTAKKHLGGPSDTADAYLISEVPSSWTSNHILRGHTYAVLTLDLNYPEFQGGPPSIMARIRGKKIYDPRLDSTVPGGSGSQRYNDSTTWTYSTNPALAALDFITSPMVGMIKADLVGVVGFYQTAANVCDEAITIAGASVEKYTVNGVVTADEAATDSLDKIADAMAGIVNGTDWSVFAGKYVAPAVTLNHIGDIVGGLTVSSGLPKSDIFNTVKGRFTGPENDYTPNDFAPYIDSVFKTADNEELVKQLEFPFTNSTQRIHNLASIQLEDNRNGMTLSGEFSYKAWRLRPGDRVYFNSPPCAALAAPSLLGMDAKVFRIVDKSFKFGEPIKLTLKEDGSTIWDLAPAVALKAMPSTNLRNPWDVPKMEGVTAESGDGILLMDTVTGAITNRLKLSWDPTVYQDKTRVEIHYRRPYDLVWGAQFGINEDGCAYGNGVRAGDEYSIRCRYVNDTLNVTGDWVYIDHTVTGKTTGPGLITDLTATSLITGIRVAGTLPTDPDLAYIELWMSLDNLIGNATRITWGLTNTYDQMGLYYSDGARYFWVRGVNTSGINGEFTGPVSETAGAAAPGIMTDLDAMAIAGGIRIQGTLPATKDLAYVELWMGTTNVLNDALRITWGLVSAYDQVGLVPADGSRYFWTRCVNVSGVPGNFVGPVDAIAGTSVAGAVASITEANDRIDDLSDDNLLTKGEKRDNEILWNQIVSYYNTKPAQATALGITTETVAFTDAYGYLQTYLTTAYASGGVGLGGSDWSDFTTDSQINGGTFRDKFDDVFDAAHALDAKIAEVSATKAVWATVSNKPDDALNIVEKSTFEDGSPGGWGGLSVVAITGQSFTKALQLGSRDGYEDPRWFPVTPGEKLYFEVDICTLNAVYQASFGVFIHDSAGGIIGWYGVFGLAPGNNWTHGTGSLTIPAGSVKAVPWIQIDGYSGFGTAEFTNLRITRFQGGATVGAPAGTFVGTTAATTVEANANNSASQLADVFSDNVLSKNEKPWLIQKYNELTSWKTYLVAEGNTRGLTTSDVTTAYSNLDGYLTGLTAWSDLSVNTAITGATLTGYVTALADALSALDIAVAAADRNSLGILINDNILKKGEKRATKNLWDTIDAFHDTKVSEATTAGVITERDVFVSEYNDLVTYLTSTYNGGTGIGVGVGGLDYLDFTTDSTISGTVWRTKFDNVFEAMHDLERALSAKNRVSASTAQSTANAAQNTADAKLNKSASDVLTGAIDVTTSGGLKVGTITWDSSGNLTGGSGIALTAQGIVGATAGAATFTITTGGVATFKGDITGGANIDITGQAKFAGAVSTGGGYFAVVANLSAASQGGVYGQGSVGVYGVANGVDGNCGIFGKATTGDTFGVKGESTQGTGVYGLGGDVGVHGVADDGYGGLFESSSGVALKVVGSLEWGSYTWTAPGGTGLILRDDGNWLNLTALLAGYSLTTHNHSGTYVTSVSASSSSGGLTLSSSGGTTPAISLSGTPSYATSAGTATSADSATTATTNLGSYSYNDYLRFFNLNDSHSVSASGSGANLVVGAGMYPTYTFHSTSGNITLDNTSDIRVKHDITTCTYGLSFINSLTLRRYRYNVEPEFYQFGLIAQELDEICTEEDHLTFINDDGMMGVNNFSLLAILMKAVQELSAEVEILKSRIPE